MEDWMEDWPIKLMDGWKNGLVEESRVAYMYSWMDACIIGWMDGKLNGWRNGLVE